MGKDKFRNCLIGNKYQQHIYMALVLLAMSVITGGGNRVSLSESVVFAIFQVCCIFIPGTVLFEYFFKKGVTEGERILLSYAAGYALSIILYFFAWFLKIYAYLKWIYVFISVFSFALIVREQKSKKTDLSESRPDWILLITILFVISFIVFSSRYMLPTFIESNQYFNDLLYWAGDAVELNMEFPPINFRTLQSNYKYHYFSALQLAVTSRVTGISIARVAFSFSFIQSTVLMGLSAYCLIARMIKNARVRVITILLLFFSTGFEKEVLVTYFWHIYLLPMGFNIAYAFEMIIILLLVIQMEEEKINPFTLIWMLVFLMICTGTKGPVGAIAMVGIGVSCLQWLGEKHYKKAFGYGLGALFIFGMVYFLFMEGAPKNYDVYVQVGNMGGVGEIKKINTVLEFIRYLVLLNPWTLWITFVYIVICAFGRKVKRDEVMLMAMIAVGVSLGHFIHMYGESQMYFSLSVFGFLAVMAGKCIDSVVDTNRIKSIDDRVRTWICRLFICIFLVCISVHTMKFSWHRNNLRDGLSHFIGRTVLDDKEDRLTNKEYEAYDWIRTNTEEMALLLSDRQLEGDMYTPGVFSERHIYCYLNEEEIEQGRKAFLGEEESIQQFTDKGIDYIVQTKRFSPDFNAEKEYCKKIFENTDIVVWKVSNEK